MTEVYPRPAKKNNALRELLSWLKYILIAVVIGLLLVVFVVQRNTVNGDSMKPNLHDGDQLIVEKVSKYIFGIQADNIVTIDTARLTQFVGEPFIIKRVIGTPGDTIEIRADGVYRNGSLLDESAFLPAGTLTQSQTSTYDKVTLGDQEYYVLGDNRPNSQDSRTFGPVPFDSIIGKPLIRFYPFEDFGTP